MHVDAILFQLLLIGVIRDKSQSAVYMYRRRKGDEFMVEIPNSENNSLARGLRFCSRILPSQKLGLKHYFFQTLVPLSQDPWRDFFVHLRRKESGLTTSKARGLKNLGNTCYLSSAMQCLSHTGLRNYFQTSNCIRGDMAKELSHLIQMMWQNDTSPLRPVNLKLSLQKLAPQFEGSGDQTRAAHRLCHWES